MGTYNTIREGGVPDVQHTYGGYPMYITYGGYPMYSREGVPGVHFFSQNRDVEPLLAPFVEPTVAAFDHF